MPQIRFSAREPASGAVLARAIAPAAASSDLDFLSSSSAPASAARPSYGQIETGLRDRPQSEDFDRQAELRSALNAGAIAAVASLIPLAFFLAAPLAGYFGFQNYQRRGRMPVRSARAGFTFGALVGLFAAPIFAVLRTAEIVASGEQGELRRAMVEKLHQAAAGNPDPYAIQIADYFSSPHGMTVLIVGGLVFLCLAFVLLAGMGGAISASMGRRRN